MTLRKRFIVGLISLHLMMSCTDGNGICKTYIGHRWTCPPTWEPWGGRCYKAITEHLTWHEAKDECLKMDSVLAAPRSQEENYFLKTLAPDYYLFWINCSDLDEEGTWKCEGGNGEVAFRTEFGRRSTKQRGWKCALRCGAGSVQGNGETETV